MSSSLTDAALARLKKQRDEDYYSPWSPGKQLTDPELIWAYIEQLKADLDVAREREFLASWNNVDPGTLQGGGFRQDEIERSRNGGW